MVLPKLAINGGCPVRREPWPAYPVYGDAEARAAARVVASNRLCAHHGPGPGEVEAFEQAFSSWLGVRHTIGVSSGTEGLHLALMAAGVGVGNEVVVPTLTWQSTATCVLMQNAVPVFADVESGTLGLDPEDVRAKITSRTRALIPVHLCGYPARMEALTALAQEYGLIVVEDCSHAHGSRFHEREVGTVGHIGVFSLQQKKCLSTGDGGLVVTDDDGYADAMRRFRSFGHAELSYNYRMTEIAAAIGQVRLRMLDGHNRVRQANAQAMAELLDGVPGVSVRRPAPGTESVYYSLLLEFEPAAFPGVTRDAFAEAVRAEGVPLVRSYAPVHRLPVFRAESPPARGCPWRWALYTAPEHERPDYGDGCCPVAEDFCDSRLMELKVHPPAGADDIAQAAEAVRKVAQCFATWVGDPRPPRHSSERSSPRNQARMSSESSSTSLTTASSPVGNSTSSPVSLPMSLCPSGVS